MNIFTSLLSLRFTDPKMEQLYINQSRESLIKYNWINNVFTLLIVIGINVMLMIYYQKEGGNQKVFFISLCVSLVLFGLTIISLIIILIKPKCIQLQKGIAFEMALISYMAFSLYRYFLYEVFNVDHAIGYFINTLEYIIRGGYVWLGIMNVQETAICAFVQLIIYISYWSPLSDWWISSIYTFSYYFVFLFITVIIIYFFTKEEKKAFALKFQIQKNFEWYESIMNKSNTGLMQISNNKVVLFNDIMVYYMKNNDNLSSFLKDKEVNDVNNDNPPNKDNENENKSKEVRSIINMRLNDFLYSLLLSSNTESMNSMPEDTNIAITLESCEDKDLKNISNRFSILELLKKKYNSLHNNSRINKTFINYGSITFPKVIEQDIGNNANNDNHLRSNLNNNEIETIKLNILYCYYQDEETKKDCFDFIFNDVTQTTKKAEFKYKSLYFSKIAHEFKNPLITILELTEKIKEEKDENETKQAINLIKAYSNYMLILAKDIEAFTNINLNEHNCLSINKMSIAEMIVFITEVANGLIARYNKSTVKFIVNADSKVLNSLIETDEIKLKQILINIISNSVKFTNQGSITLDIHFSEDNKLIKFIISDTGIGMNEMTKQNLLCPFFRTTKSNNLGTGLGMCIISELSKMLNANLEYNSIENIGTKFWLDIPLILSSSETNEKITINYAKTSQKKSQNNIVNRYSLMSLSPIKEKVNKKSSVDLDNNFNYHNINISQISTSNTFKLDINPFMNKYIDKNKDNKSIESIQTSIKKCINIIVADDEPIIRKSTIRVLLQISQANSIPIQIYEANDGFEILYFITAGEPMYQKYDLILCDENMVYCNGIKCQKELNYLISQQKISHIPFYILSANYSYTSIGAFHISKPLSNDIAEQLLNSIAAEISLLR